MSAIAEVGLVDPLIKEARDRQRHRRQRMIAAIVASAVAAGGAYGVINISSSSNAPATCIGALCAAGPSKRDPSAGGVLYGFLRSYAAPSTIARADPNSLQLTGRQLVVSTNYEPAGLSPDGKRLLLLDALPPTRHSGETALAVVDLPTMHRDSGLEAHLATALGQRRPVAALWQTPRRLLVVVQELGRRRWRRGPRVVVGQNLVAFNAMTGAVEWKRRLSATLLPTYSGTGTVGSNAIFVLQSSDREHSQHATVMTVSARGATHSSALRLIEGGYRSYPAQLVVTSDVAGKHAFVLTGGGVVYDVDPVTARTTRHRLGLPNGAPATSPPDLLLSAASLGGNIVVSSFLPRPNGFPAAGIYLIDPRTWKARLVEPTTPAWLVANNRLLTFTAAGQFRLPSSWRSKGTGIRIYDAGGRLRSHLYGTQAFTGIAVAPGFALAVLPAVQPAASPPNSAAEHQARDRAIRIHELVFDLRTGQGLGKRLQIGYPPGLIQPPTVAAHR